MLDAATFRAIPVTSVARTLADLSPLVSQDDLYLAVREAMYLRRFDLAAVEEVLTRRRARALRLLMEDLTYTQGALERDFLRLCDRYGLPRPVTQRRVGGAKVDFTWPDRRVAVETDGWRAHGTLAAFQSDRSKSNALVARGWRVMRFTHADVQRRPARTARTLGRVLGG
jgi:very-short-patch-repair endonuclease